MNSPSPSDMKYILEQWMLFQQGKLPNPSIIRPSLLESWIRSRNYGVSPDKRNRESVSPEQLESILEQNQDFINSAVNIIGKLYKSIESLRGTITLADKNGVVLYFCHQKQTEPEPAHVIGDILLERVCGTNGIGTCLAEGHPVELIGAEHFLKEDHSWYCSSAPIYDSRSNIIGVFNISIPCGQYYYQSGGLVEAIAHAITEQIFLSEMLTEQMVILNQLEEGVIVLNGDGVIKSINKKACSILRPSIPPHGQNFRRIFHTQNDLVSEIGHPEPFENREIIFISGIHTIPCKVSCSPLPAGGCILILQKINRSDEVPLHIIGTKAVYTFDNILGSSDAIKKAICLGKKASKSDIMTLILGESGTGKELFAQSIHNAGDRRKGPFVAVNCGAIPRNLVQSELFGYSEGSFTGAIRQGKPGKFELANGGTIFLDEIGEMPLDAQVSLLRLLQNGEVTRVGSKSSTYVNVRVIAATNKNVQEALQLKTFRHDLYYRLNTFVLNIPSLRDRGDDIFLLAESFLKKFSAILGKNITGFEKEVYPLLKSYSWPGNVRELENCIECAVAVTESEHVRVIDLPPSVGGHIFPVPMKGKLKNNERETICRTLDENGWNIRQTAISLGISRSTLYIKIKKFGIKKQ